MVYTNGKDIGNCHLYILPLKMKGNTGDLMLKIIVVACTFGYLPIL